MTRRLTIVAFAALLALTGCAKKTPTVAATADTVLTPSGAASPTATAKATTNPTSPPKNSPSVTTPPTGPAILYFRVKTKPNCESVGGGGQVFPARDAVLEWAVVNVTEVTISIDGPGLFGTYDATSTQTLPFSCGGQTNTTYKHTYTLRTVGGGPVQTQTITVEARKS